MSKERELLKECRLMLDNPINGTAGRKLQIKITELLTQPEQPEPVYWENEKKALLNEIDHLTNRLAQPELSTDSLQLDEQEPVEICPNCGSKVTWYHCREGTRVVCGDKCQGYKVIASRGRRDECFTKGDL